MENYSLNIVLVDVNCRKKALWKKSLFECARVTQGEIVENKIKITSFEDGLVIKISGELDSYKTMIYRDKINLSISTKKPHLLLFDLKDLTFLDSAGIGLIIGRYNDMKKVGGLVGLVGLNTYSRRLVTLTGLSTIIKEYRSIGAFKKEAQVRL